MGVGGSGASTPPAIFSLATSGFWNDVAGPRAAYYNGKTYLAWVTSDGHIHAAQYAHSTRTLSTPVDLATTSGPDGTIHNSPAILVRASDHRIIVAASEDLASAQPALWTSTNPEDATAFGSVQLIPPSVASPSYPNIEQLASVTNQPIYYFVRIYDSGASTFYTGYFKSTDGGATWAAFQKLWKPVATSAQYHTILGDGASRIDFFVTDTNRTVGNPSSVYHAYLDGSSGNLYKSDGTLIGAASAGPYFATAGTLVQDASLGSCRSEAAGYSGGKPHVLLIVNDGNTTTNTLARVGRWTGSTWQVNAVASAGGIIDSNWFISSGSISKSDPNTVYFPIKVGSHFELWRYTSPDGGTTWGGSALTSGSASDNAMPDTPLNATPTFRVLWGLGTYTSDSSFTFTMQGYG